jgi:ElaB/YqjD/DUF883 family membrane-anchored ribosome-binding protein
MARIGKMRSDIESLLRELKDIEKADKRTSTRQDQQSAEADESVEDSNPIHDAIEALKSLRDHVQDAAQEAGDAVTEHPYAATASAFLLGLIVGRLLKHF